MWGDVSLSGGLGAGCTLAWHYFLSVSRFHAGNGTEERRTPVEDAWLSVNGSLSTCVTLSGNV